MQLAVTGSIPLAARPVPFFQQVVNALQVLKTL